MRCILRLVISGCISRPGHFALAFYCQWTQRFRETRTSIPMSNSDTRRTLVPASLLVITCISFFPSRVDGGSVWTQVQLVENTAEGPSYERCRVETLMPGGGETARINLYYGESRPDSTSRWSAIRPASGCRHPRSRDVAQPWMIRGTPYLLVDVDYRLRRIDGGDLIGDVTLSIRRLSGFNDSGVPEYESKLEKRNVRLSRSGSAVLPVLIANSREQDEFRVRELLLTFRSNSVNQRPAIEYGTIAVNSDISRAEILLDGSFIGRTSSTVPTILENVRVGQREVLVRDASGRAARSLVQVRRHMQTSAAINLLTDRPRVGNGFRRLNANAQGSMELWREKDGAIVVRIPGGEFKMGSPDGEGDSAEHPQHSVRVGDFLIDKTEVTWGQYQRFVAAAGRTLPRAPIWGMPEALPVSNVTWSDAREFCSWVGGRLPTEAEWEHAARGDDSRRYPWGSEWDPWRCNTRDGGPHAPQPAGSFPDCVSPYGVLDLAGSVWEWCSDWYDTSYYARSPRENPKGPNAGALRVSRGGDWMTASFSTRVANRQGIDPGWPNPMRGFRCAHDISPEFVK